MKNTKKLWQSDSHWLMPQLLTLQEILKLFQSSERIARQCPVLFKKFIHIALFILLLIFLFLRQPKMTLFIYLLIK